MSSVGFPFGWNIPSGFGIVPSQYGGTLFLGDLISHGVAHYFLGRSIPSTHTIIPRGTSLGGNFAQWGGYPFIHTSSPGGFFPGLVLVWEVIFL
jgi:hypothetical protein